MIGSRFWVRRTGATIGISGALIVAVLVVKSSGCERGMKVGPTIGGGTGSRGGGGVSVGWEVVIKVEPTLGDSVAGESVVSMGGKGIMGGTVVFGVEMRRGVGLFRRSGIK